MIAARLAAALLVAALAVPAHAVDLNTASQAELESVKGIGVATSNAILAERAKRPFADWADVARRVKGAGSRRFASAGLTVNGAPHPSASGSAAAATSAP